MKCPRCQHENPAGMRFAASVRHGSRLSAPRAVRLILRRRSSVGSGQRRSVSSPSHVSRPWPAPLAPVSRPRRITHRKIVAVGTSAYETIPGTAFAARQNMEMPT
jgi:hypothetical protein